MFRSLSTHSVHVTFRFACMVAALVAVSGGPVLAQEGVKGKDDTLDSLLKELSEPAKTATAPAADQAARKKADSPKSKAEAGPSKPDSPTSRAADKNDKTVDKKTAKPKTDQSAAGKVAPKDQALDDLLNKLGETKDEPSPEERQPGGGSGENDRRQQQQQPKDGHKKPGADKLGDKDKDLDERLEELTGRRKKQRNSPSEQEQAGPIGEMIKEMRDVEQRLGKPDTSEDTQKRQKQIVKRIETLIEQAKQSGSMGGRLTLRRVRQPGQQPGGQQPGDQTGALARGAPPMKPAKPTTQHSTADSKDTWGHLPDELRQVMENSFKEVGLESKQDLISRYFLSVGKGKRVREE